MDEMKLREIISQNLDALMARSQNLGSQPKLSNKAGVGASTIGRILRKEIDTTAQTLDSIARPFGLRGMDLQDPSLLDRIDRGEAGKEPLISEPQAITEDPEEAFLLKRFREAAQDRRDQALTILLVGSPQQSKATGLTMRELLAEWKDVLAQEIGVDLEKYDKAESEKARDIIKMDIGGRVIQMIDARRQNHDPPNGIEDRRSGTNSK